MRPSLGALFLSSSIISMVASTSVTSSPGTPTMPYSFNFRSPPSCAQQEAASLSSRRRAVTCNSHRNRSFNSRAARGPGGGGGGGFLGGTGDTQQRYTCPRPPASACLCIYSSFDDVFLIKLLVHDIPHSRRAALNGHCERLRASAWSDCNAHTTLLMGPWRPPAHLSFDPSDRSCCASHRWMTS